LLCGSKPGPEKVKKATELGVEILDEAQFRSLIGESTVPPAGEEVEPTLF